MSKVGNDKWLFISDIGVDEKEDEWYKKKQKRWWIYIFQWQLIAFSWAYFRLNTFVRYSSSIHMYAYMYIPKANTKRCHRKDSHYHDDYEGLIDQLKIGVIFFITNKVLSWNEINIFKYNLLMRLSLYIYFQFSWDES